VFFSSYTLNSGGYVAKVGVCGGTVETVATAFVVPFTTPIALDSNHFYFSWNDNTSPASVMKCPKSGCVGFPPVLATTAYTNITALAVDSTNVYWLDALIMKTPVGGGATTAVGGTSITNFAVDSTDAYWSNNSGLWKCNLNGCTNPTPVGPPQGHGFIVMDGNNVYTADNGGGSVYSCPKTGCVTATKLDTGNIIQGFATDGLSVYWSDTDGTAGWIKKCAVGGCNQTPTMLVTTQLKDVPKSIALDGTSIYWTTLSGKVMRANK
jgi:hypothetical protein